MEDTSPPHRLSGSASMPRLQARDQQNRPIGLAGRLKELSVLKNPYLEVTPTLTLLRAKNDLVTPTFKVAY